MSWVRILETFPLQVAERLPNVFHLGFHSKQSFGAASYFVTASESLGLLGPGEFRKMGTPATKMYKATG